MHGHHAFSLVLSLQGRSLGTLLVESERRHLLLTQHEHGECAIWIAADPARVVLLSFDIVLYFFGLLFQWASSTDPNVLD